MVKQFHRGAVAQGMRGQPLAGGAWAGTRSSQTVFADQKFQGITREWIATDGREKRPIIVAEPIFQTVLQGVGAIPTKRRATSLATCNQTADMCPGAEEEIPGAQTGQCRGHQSRRYGAQQRSVLTHTLSGQQAQR